MNYKLNGFLALQTFYCQRCNSHIFDYTKTKKVVSANQISFQIAIFVKQKKVRYEVKHEM